MKISFQIPKMDKYASAVILTVFIALVILTTAALASGMVSSSNYVLPWSAFSNGGSPMQSTSYHVQGHLVAGFSGSTGSSLYKIQSGFWPGGQLISPAVQFRTYLPLIRR